MFASNIFTTRRAHVVSFIRAIIPLPDGERFNFCHAHGVITGLSLILFANECTSVFSSQTLCSVLLHRGLRTYFLTQVARSSLTAALPLGTGGFIPAAALPLHHRRLLSPPALPLSTGSSSLHWRILFPLAFPSSSPAVLFSAFTDEMWSPASVPPAAAAHAPAVTAALLCALLLPQMASA